MKQKSSRSRTRLQGGRRRCDWADPVTPIRVEPDERATLERWARRPHDGAGAGAARARLCCGARPATRHTAIARGAARDEADGRQMARGGSSRRGSTGLLDEPRPGAPRKITDAQVERVIATTLESTPRDATHWSTRSDWRSTAGLSQSERSRASGGRSRCSRIASRRSSSRRIRCSSTKCATSSGCIWIRRIARCVLCRR